MRRHREEDCPYSQRSLRERGARPPRSLASLNTDTDIDQGRRSCRRHRSSNRCCNCCSTRRLPRPRRRLQRQHRNPNPADNSRHRIPGNPRSVVPAGRRLDDLDSLDVLLLGAKAVDLRPLDSPDHRGCVLHERRRLERGLPSCRHHESPARSCRRREKPPPPRKPPPPPRRANASSGTRLAATRIAAAKPIRLYRTIASSRVVRCRRLLSSELNARASGTGGNQFSSSTLRT
ncbi:hypothetical protein ACVWYQ_000173 [Bradyrhizobium sp. USDA 3397]